MAPELVCGGAPDQWLVCGHSDNGFILAGPRLERVDEGGHGFSADGVGTFASFYRGPEAA